MSDPSQHPLIDHAFKENTLYTGVVGTEVVGFVIIARGHFYGRDFIELLKVAAAHQRRGYGEKLMLNAENYIQGGEVFTSTNQSNTTAQALYKKIGYVESGTIENLDPGDPEIVLYKKLS